ncbi:pentapeptide repeat-containing protein [Mucisphaera calidilacus]|uniref:Secreted effector protein pipB2 n=1 Tax=Mucisphaera calidilacus TaxID=2527982 RepID=A0A518BTV2_9BACT|nr:pentapeptide repeat-containing protein [Mucisphaera calidilacus]QDU70408.1 Secreted effector protein pipB2 [Mucisphaera calidilacus]
MRTAWIAALTLCTTTTHANIYQWQYIDPANPSLGKQQSTTLAPGGAGATAEPRADLTARDLTMAWLRDANLNKADISHANLTNADLVRANLTSVLFIDTRLADADLSHANLDDTAFHASDLSNARLTHVDLSNRSMSEVDLTGADLTGSNLSNLRLSEVNLFGANLTDTIITGIEITAATPRGFTAEQLYSTASYRNKNLSNVSFSRSTMTDWDLSGQNLQGSHFYEVTLIAANLSHANLRNSNYLDSKLIGANLSHANLENIYVNNCDLSYSDLSHANLSNAWFESGPTRFLYVDFSYANLSNAIMTSSNDSPSFTGANFTHANLTGVNLYGIDGRTITIDHTDLTNTNLQAANLTGLKLKGSTLVGTKLDKATLHNTDFTDVDLTNASLKETDLATTNFTNSSITGVNLKDTTGFSQQKLLSTRSYQHRDLSGITLPAISLTGLDLSGFNLDRLDLSETNTTGIVITNATIAYANFNTTASSHNKLTRDMLESTLSYQQGHLPGLGLEGHDLSGWDLAGANLAHSNFFVATLHSTNLTNTNLDQASFLLTKLSLVDFRGATNLTPEQLSSLQGNATYIGPDGSFQGFQLLHDEAYIWDYQPKSHDQPIPITFHERLIMTPTAAIHLVFADKDWGSTITFADPQTPVQIAGTLILEFDDDLTLADLLLLDGVTYQLFDWTHADITGTFDAIEYHGPGSFDTSSLMTTGEVTFHLIPEPNSLVTLALTGLALARRRSA